MLSAVIIDDEESSIKILEELLTNQTFIEIKIAGTALNLNDGINIIRNTLPDIVFLDIHMPIRNGLEIYNEFKSPNFKIIFCTAYPEHAIEAITKNSSGYILKPIDFKKLEEILTAVNHKLLEEQQQRLLEDKFNVLCCPIKKGENILLEVENGFFVQNTRNIEYCYVKDSYSVVVMQSQKEYIIKKPLKDLYKQLPNNQFYQTHKSYLVNIYFIREFVHSKNSYVILERGFKIPVSNRRTLVIANEIKRKMSS